MIATELARGIFHAFERFVHGGCRLFQSAALACEGVKESSLQFGLNAFGQTRGIDFLPAAADWLVKARDRRDCSLRGLRGLGGNVLVAFDDAIQLHAQTSQRFMRWIDDLVPDHLRCFKHVKSVRLHDQNKTAQGVGHFGVLREMAD
jgi:hypothetical protein